jgi:hypothetical protein
MYYDILGKIVFGSWPQVSSSCALLTLARPSGRRKDERALPLARSFCLLPALLSCPIFSLARSCLASTNARSSLPSLPSTNHANTLFGCIKGSCVLEAASCTSMPAYQRLLSVFGKYTCPATLAQVLVSEASQP